MKTLARHLIAELYGCPHERLDDLDGIRAAMLEAAEVVGATILKDAFHPFEPDGVSGVVVIAESHLSIHTWPRRNYAAVDIFTCGGLDPQPGCAHLARRLGAEGWRLQEILRGLPEDLGDASPLLPDDVQVITELQPSRPLPA